MDKLLEQAIDLARVAGSEVMKIYTKTDKIHQWDTAAGEIILKEAGGVVADLYGKPLVYCREKTNHPNGILACNKALYPKMLSRLQEMF